MSMQGTGQSVLDIKVVAFKERNSNAANKDQGWFFSFTSNEQQNWKVQVWMVLRINLCSLKASLYKYLNNWIVQLFYQNGWIMQLFHVKTEMLTVTETSKQFIKLQLDKSLEMQFNSQEVK